LTTVKNVLQMKIKDQISENKLKLEKMVIYSNINVFLLMDITILKIPQKLLNVIILVKPVWEVKELNVYNVPMNMYGKYYQKQKYVYQKKANMKKTKRLKNVTRAAKYVMVLLNLIVNNLVSPTQPIRKVNVYQILASIENQVNIQLFILAQQIVTLVLKEQTNVLVVKNQRECNYKDLNANVP